MTDLRRNLETKINDFLSYFPIVIILGVRQCGKTTLSKMLRSEWQYFDLERSRDFDFVSRDFEFFVKEHPYSVIIDEAQRYPAGRRSNNSDPGDLYITFSYYPFNYWFQSDGVNARGFEYKARKEIRK